MCVNCESTNFLFMKRRKVSTSSLSLLSSRVRERFKCKMESEKQKKNSLILFTVCFWQKVKVSLFSGATSTFAIVSPVQTCILYYTIFSTAFANHDRTNSLTLWLSLCKSSCWKIVIINFYYNQYQVCKFAT